MQLLNYRNRLSLHWLTGGAICEIGGGSVRLMAPVAQLVSAQ